MSWIKTSMEAVVVRCRSFVLYVIDTNIYFDMFYEYNILQNCRCLTLVSALQQYPSKDIRGAFGKFVAWHHNSQCV